MAFPCLGPYIWCLFAPLLPALFLLALFLPPDSDPCFHVTCIPLAFGSPIPRFLSLTGLIKTERKAQTILRSENSLITPAPQHTVFWVPCSAPLKTTISGEQWLFYNATKPGLNGSIRVPMLFILSEPKRNRKWCIRLYLHNVHACLLFHLNRYKDKWKFFPLQF